MKLKIILVTGGILLSGWLAASYATAQRPEMQVAQELSK